jgi:hypothetical protein
MASPSPLLASRYGNRWLLPCPGPKRAPKNPPRGPRGASEEARKGPKSAQEVAASVLEERGKSKIKNQRDPREVSWGGCFRGGPPPLKWLFQGLRAHRTGGLRPAAIF